MSTAVLDYAASAIEDRTPRAVDRLRSVTAAGDFGRVEWHWPVPSAAFSRLDTRRPDFDRARAEVAACGFRPFIRPVGGKFVAYDQGWLVLDLFVRSQDPRVGTTARFRAMADVLAEGLRDLGADARVGQVPGEYCPGDWSVNIAGRTKIVGTGQRLTSTGVLFTAVIAVTDIEPAHRVMAQAYEHLGYELDQSSIGSLEQHLPGVTHADVLEAVGGAIARHLPVSDPQHGFSRALLGTWDPR